MMNKQIEEAEYRRIVWRLEHRIYGNAKRFAKKAAKGLGSWADAEDRVFSIVHVMVAIELLLKAKIANHDARLLKTGKGMPSLDELRSGRFYSLTVEAAIKILESECGVFFRPEQKSTIDSLVSARNSIVHLHGVEDDVRLAVSIAEGLNFFIAFSFQECPSDHTYQDDAKRMATDWTEYPKFCECRVGSLQEQLNSRPRPRTRYTSECGHCSQEADVLDGDQLLCLFCYSSEPVNEYACRRSEDQTASDCPECHRVTVMTVFVRGQIVKECFCCGYLLEGPEPEWSNINHRVPRLRPAFQGPSVAGS
jgi:hypothetical protein